MAGQIAIIEPDLGARLLLRARLTEEYHRVATLADPADPAAEALIDGADLAFIDSGASGRALMARLARRQGARHVPIIATLRPEDDPRAVLSECFRLGADDVVSREDAASGPLALARLRRLIAASLAARDLPHRRLPQVEGLSARRPAPVLLSPSDAPQPALLSGLLRAGILSSPAQAGAAAPGAPILVWLGQPRCGEAGLRLIARLPHDTITRHSPILALCPPDDPHRAAQALALGAGEAVTIDTPWTEIAARHAALLRRADRADALRAALAQELALAHTDPLTGLGNRRMVETLLPARLARMKAAGECLALILLDIDRFKRVNDRHGHACGDRVLAEVAARLRLASGDAALLARMGGEEFLVAVPVRDQAAAARHAERLRRAVERTPVLAARATGPLTVTVSAGIAVARPGDTLEALVQDADAALYRCKAAGRNRVMLAARAA
ncbi:diguanylate cyclase [Halovulum dunhuangense]|uniref:diguanylate cyclase n=1 Tax=Halovulum dunhuangense TaxID=1505036 RepID=A0A849L4Y7_9RHOB|nr:GGDEF domain-containing protein [Halovulum dunhuangense]NNU81419.1 diguanylate cyclase [Halovulum dunhuangense]